MVKGLSYFGTRSTLFSTRIICLVQLNSEKIACSSSRQRHPSGSRASNTSRIISEVYRKGNNATNNETNNERFMSSRQQKGIPYNIDFQITSMTFRNSLQNVLYVPCCFLLETPYPALELVEFEGAVEEELSKFSLVSYSAQTYIFCKGCCNNQNAIKCIAKQRREVYSQFVECRLLDPPKTKTK